MSAPTKSRWANDDDPEIEAILAQRKREKEAKRRAKAERQRKVEEDKQQQQEAIVKKEKGKEKETESESQPPKKRRRLSNEPPTTATPEAIKQQQKGTKSHLLVFPTREWRPCRHVNEFERLNHIEEGSYGWVSRAKETKTGEIVALKKLKMENSPDGFPVTGLREIQTLLEARHENIVHLREVVTAPSATGHSMYE